MVASTGWNVDDVRIYTCSSTQPKPAARGDFNKDGHPDLLWRNKANGINVIWHMSGEGSNYTSYVNPPTVADTNWELIAPR